MRFAPPQPVSTKQLQVWSAAIVLFLVACGPAASSNVAEPEPDLELTIIAPGYSATPSLQQALVTAIEDDRRSIKSVHATIESGAGLVAATTWLEPGFPKTSVIEDLSPGDYTVTACALDNEEGPIAAHTLYSSSSRVTVFPGSRVATTLIMQEIAPGPDNITAPFINAVSVAGGPPAIGKPLHLTATVTGAPSQTYRWAVSCGSEDESANAFTNPTGTSTDLTLYRCSEDAIVTFSVTNPGNPNAKGSLTSSVQFKLDYVSQGIDLAGISLNSWPNIWSIGTTSNTAPLPGGQVRLAATASDPDGDHLVYTWSDDCGGTFAGADTLTPTWTAPLSRGTTCVLTLTVRESGNEPGHNEGYNSGSFTLQVAPSI